ncbi:MAG: outer membrane beta-barrel protein, partial [Rhizobacter sp.]|nr:outer membrane beta-barrel protein [Rhizobacter sp.]
SRNLDFLADYTSGALTGNLRLSYTDHSNSQISGGNFSGFTGSLVTSWQATAKTRVQFDISRDDGFDTANTSRYAVVQVGSGISLTPVPFSYYNNRLTSTVGLGVAYAATEKVAFNARARYLRSHVRSPQAPNGVTSDYTDEFKGASIGATYAITRAWGASCSLGFERRDVSGSTAYDYNANTISCATQFTWR